MNILLKPTQCARLAAALFIAGSPALVASPSHAALTAQQILQRQATSMQSLKSYQATWKTSSSMGMNNTMTLSSIPASGKIRMVVTSSGMGMPGGARSQVIMVDDGKFMYSYMGYNNSWSKAPHKKELAKMFSNMGAMGGGGIADKNATYKLLPSTTLGGRPVHVVQVRMPGRFSMLVTHYVDKATFRSRQTTVNMTMPQQRGKPMTVTTRTVLVSEKVNAPIPASVFRFTPPPGSKEMKGSPFGAIGGPRPIGRRPGTSR